MALRECWRESAGHGLQNKETPMLGLMQEQPLLISQLIEFAARHHPEG
jgi:hypothetical protein